MKKLIKGFRLLIGEVCLSVSFTIYPNGIEKVSLADVLITHFETIMGKETK